MEETPEKKEDRPEKSPPVVFADDYIHLDAVKDGDKFHEDENGYWTAIVPERVEVNGVPHEQYLAGLQVKIAPGDREMTNKHPMAIAKGQPVNMRGVFRARLGETRVYITGNTVIITDSDLELG